MDGAELADSVVVNPHKWMFVPLDFSALFVRRPELLRQVFSLTPEYLRGDADARRGQLHGLRHPARPTVPRAQSVDGVRAFGQDGIAARIREHCRLARLWARWVDEDERFVLAAPVPMGVVCFRFAPAGLDDAACDRLNEQIVAGDERVRRGVPHAYRVGGRIVMRVGDRKHPDDRAASGRGMEAAGPGSEESLITNRSIIESLNQRFEDPGFKD